MGTFGKEFEAPTNVIGNWDVPTRIDLSVLGLSKTYSSEVGCEDFDGTTFQYGVLFDAGAVDDVELEVYSTSDTGDWAGTDEVDIPILSILVNRVSGDEVFGEIKVRDVEYCRISAVMTGTDDGHGVRVRSARFRDKTN